MLNVTNLVGKDKSRWPKENPRWPKGNTTETIKVPDLCLGATTWGRCDSPSGVADTVRGASTLAAAWLIGLPRRAGRRLFAMNDREAGWRGWQVTELRGGLARSYRDRRFDLLRDLRALSPQTPDTPDWLEPPHTTDPPKTLPRRPVDGWDDVHGWLWDGEK
jgi:hypothetical protein